MAPLAHRIVRFDQSKEAEPMGQYDGWRRGWAMLDDPNKYVPLALRTRF